jgi:hypothetical protein
MNKLPVGQTIRYAYAFTFGEIGTIIGLIWIPTLINAVAGFFVSGAYYRALADSFDSGLPPAGAEVSLPFLLAFLSMLLLAMIAVAITRQALGLRQGPAFAHVALGSAELRAFGGFFGLYLLLVLFVLVIALIVGGVAIGAATAIKANAGSAPIVGAGVGLAVLIGVLVLIYLTIRLSFLLVPSVVDGSEFGLTRSWQLTKGNFWRIAAVGAVTLLPVTLVFGITEFVILGPEFFKPDLPGVKDTTVSLHRMAEQMRAMQAHMPVLMGLSFVISPVLYGLAFSAAAFAYRALSGTSGEVSLRSRE